MRRRKTRMTLWLEKDCMVLLTKESKLTKKTKTTIIREAIKEYLHSKYPDVHDIC